MTSLDPNSTGHNFDFGAIMKTAFISALAFSLFVSSGKLRGHENVDDEIAYIQHLAGLAGHLGCGNSEIEFWRKLSGLADRNASVWSITDRTYGAVIKANVCEEVAAPGRLQSDGDGCNVWRIREISNHSGIRKQLRASMRTREPNGDFGDYECVCESRPIAGIWYSSYYTVSLENGSITQIGEFPVQRIGPPVKSVDDDAP